LFCGSINEGKEQVSHLTILKGIAEYIYASEKYILAD
jgi:hypothetical protein